MVVEYLDEQWLLIVSHGHTLIHRKRVWWTDDGQFFSFTELIGETATLRLQKRGAKNYSFLVNLILIDMS